MNIESFTGRALAYVKSRPSYPKEVIDYIYKLAPPDAIFADIGAGTGKFTELIARYENEIFAVEPNADMSKQLVITLAPFSNIKIIKGTAEATKLPDKSVDVITCAQVLNHLNLEAFQLEYKRIGKSNFTVISLHNHTPGEVANIARYKKSTDAFFSNPIVLEFPNPIYFTRDKWLLYHQSMSGVPMTESDAGYEEYMAELNEIFDRDSINGILCENLITKVYSERML